MTNKMVLISFEVHQIIGISADRFCQNCRIGAQILHLKLCAVCLHKLPSPSSSVSNDAPAAISAALRKLESMSHWQD